MALQISAPNKILDSAIDQGPYVNVSEDGMVAALNNGPTVDNVDEIDVRQDTHHDGHDRVPEESKRDELVTNNVEEIHVRQDAMVPEEGKKDELVTKTNTESGDSSCIAQTTSAHNPVPLDVVTPFKRYLGQLSRQNRWSIWLLAYIAITTSWPLVGSALHLVFGKRLRDTLPRGLVRR